MKLAGFSFACASAVIVVSSAFVLATGCGSSKSGSGFDDGDNANASGDGGTKIGDGGTGFSGGGRDDAGIDCAVSGTVSGTAYAPNGTLPLYNVIVYAPSAPLAPFTEGVSCDKCGSVSGNPVASTVSDATGKFQLRGVPAGDNVPIVFQVGKWRRQVTIPHVNAGCADNPITDPNLSRLPRNHSEGDIPHIAVTTGGCDSIACVLPKMGIDASEFGNQSQYADHRVIMYEGSGPAAVSGITPAQNLWGSSTELAKYDVAIFSCECSEHPETKATGDEAIVANYLNAGGRTFGTDFMYTWVHQGHSYTDTPPAPINGIMQGFVGNAPYTGSVTATIDTSFPKGKALDDWLEAVGGSSKPGKVDLTNTFGNFDHVDPTLAQRWVYADTQKAISFTTPFSEPNEADRCGKSYFMDIHVGSGSVDSSGHFPTGCGTDLSPQEKMMVFFLMDLASCIQDDTQPVNPPR